MRQRRTLFLLLGIIALVAAFWSLLSLNVSAHKTLDQRVYDVGSQLKCPVCQSESVADSPSLIAQQMRGVIRQQLQAGRSEQQVMQYFINTYGEQIAWSPPWQGFTLLAWLVPIALILIGAGLLFLTCASGVQLLRRAKMKMRGCWAISKNQRWSVIVCNWSRSLLLMMRYLENQVGRGTDVHFCYTITGSGRTGVFLCYIHYFVPGLSKSLAPTFKLFLLKEHLRKIKSANRPHVAHCKRSSLIFNLGIPLKPIIEHYANAICDVPWYH